MLLAAGVNSPGYFYGLPLTLGECVAKPDSKKETCSKCGSTIFSVAKDNSNKHYCQAKGCGNVWVPGLEGMKRADVVMAKLSQENEALKTEIAKLRAELKRYAEEHAEEDLFT